MTTNIIARIDGQINLQFLSYRKIKNEVQTKIARIHGQINFLLQLNRNLISNLCISSESDEKNKYLFV